MIKYIAMFLFVTGVKSVELKVTTLQGNYDASGTLGVIPVSHCGGSAAYVETRISDCTESPCDLTATTLIEVVFVPMTTTLDPTTKITFAPKVGRPWVQTDVVVGRTLTGGVNNTFALKDMTGDLIQKEARLYFEVINSVGDLEVCVSDHVNAPAACGVC